MNSPSRYAASIIGDLHRHGNEIAWWANLQIVPIEAAKELWNVTLLGADVSIARKDPRQPSRDQGGRELIQIQCETKYQDGAGVVSSRNDRESCQSDLRIARRCRLNSHHLSEPSCLLPGESLRDFEAIRQMMVEDIQPATNIEWLWTLDLVELSWEILRYRRLKERILDAHRASRDRSDPAATGRGGDAGGRRANGADTSEADGGRMALRSRGCYRH